MSKSVKLNLLENSHSFLVEAVDKAIGAENNVKHWQFAILNLVQSLELSLKLVLKNIHPLFIFENIDKPTHTISITNAIKRISNPEIGNVVFTKNEKNGMQSAIKLRNEITHSEFELSVDYAQAHFFRVFSLLATIQRRQFGHQIEDFLSEEAIGSLIIIDKSRKVLTENAIQRIKDEDIKSSYILECPNCLSDTFVIHDSIDTCYSCSYNEEFRDCPHCENLFFSSELEPIHNHFDIDYCEGLATIHNSYGYDDIDVCSDCAQKIAQDIEEKRLQELHDDAEYHYWMEND